MTDYLKAINRVRSQLIERERATREMSRVGQTPAYRFRHEGQADAFQTALAIVDFELMELNS